MADLTGRVARCDESTLNANIDETETTAYVLDTSAVMAFLQYEPGRDRVGRLLEDAEAGRAAVNIASVNAAEVLYTLWRRVGEESARLVIDDLLLIGIQFHDADLSLSLRAGALKAEYPMSLADCYAAALAQQLDATVVTGDPEFKCVEEVVRIEWLS